MRHYRLLFILIAVCCSCKGTAQKNPLLSRTVRDTIFVSTPLDQRAVDSIARSLPDSLSEIRDLLTKRGEFVSASAKLEKPLLPLGWASDYTGLFTASEYAALDSMITWYKTKTGNEIAVVTLDSSWFLKDDFEDFVLRIHNSWGVGQREKNNGILFAICTGYRRVRISNGFGIEGRLSDSATKAIIDESIVPEFKKGNYFKGTRAGLLRLMAALPD